MQSVMLSVAGGSTFVYARNTFPHLAYAATISFKCNEKGFFRFNLPGGKNNANMSLPSDCPSTNLEQAPAAILVLSVVVADFVVLADYW